LPKAGGEGHDSAAGQGSGAKGGQLSKGDGEGSADGGGMIFGGPVSPADYTGAMVHFGGPLSGPVVALHGSRELAEAEAGAGIYVAAQKKNLEQLVKQQTGNVRLIIGHAAWSSEQLDKEFEAGFWHILPATPEMVLPIEQDLWPLLFRRAAGASIAKWLGTTDTGGNVELN
jgi:putative transcriptional regulator